MSAGREKFKVSVIVPIYGAGRYLHQCIDSILVQTLKEIEIILVDDGSKDECPQICDAYGAQDKRIKVIHKPNSGYGHSVNVGIEVASGEYVGIVDADDWIEPDMFETLYALAWKYQADVVESDFFRYVSKTNSSRAVNMVPQTEANRLITPAECPDVLNMVPVIWTSIYKKEFLNRTGIRLLETPGASYQDTGFHFKVWFEARKVYLIDRAFYHYRIDNADSSVRNMQKIVCVCDEWKEIIRFLKIKGSYERFASRVCELQYNTYMWNWKRLPFVLQKQFICIFASEFKSYQEAGLLKSEIIDRKKYKRILEIINNPNYFMLKYRILHLPKYILKKLSGTWFR